MRSIKVFTTVDDIPLWLKELIHCSKIFYLDPSIPFYELSIPNHSVLICEANQENSFVAFCERNSFHYGLIINGDEALQDFSGYLSSELCVFLIRNYFHPVVHKNAIASNCLEKVLYIKAGSSKPFRKAVDNTINELVSIERDYIWSFVCDMVEIFM